MRSVAPWLPSWPASFGTASAKITAESCRTYGPSSTTDGLNLVVVGDVVRTLSTSPIGPSATAQSQVPTNRPSLLLSHDVLCRGSFLLPRPRRSPAAYARDGRWMCESLMVGESRRASDGRTLEKGVLYASAQGAAPLDAFHELEVDADLFAHLPLRPLSVDAYAVPGSHASSTVRNADAFCYIPQLRDGDLKGRVDAVLNYLQKNPGVAYCKARSGARDAVLWGES